MPSSRSAAAPLAGVVRTPDERFSAVPNFPWEPRYLDDLPGFEGLRLHYIDAGPPTAEVTFVCLHGEPTWSFLYRKMIPLFVAAGHRALAFDFFGFGRSDKPVDEARYTVPFHRNTALAVLRRLAPRNVCLVVQDWGGIIGLTLPMELPDMISRLIVMNTALPIGEPLGQGFADWRAFVAGKPDFPVSGLMKRSVAGLPEEEAAAYDAPFPDPDYRAGLRRFPELVMTDPGMEGIAESRRARTFLSQAWTGESFMAVGAKDPVFSPAHMEGMRKLIRNCPEVMQVPEGGHFVQEHGGPIAAAALARFRLG
ncbi:MAG: alpha/beta fold hydrolase [Alphaproteobacteria bacterium]|nr:alpha/beta fold hydrolase [Alphaproteobacteria bacterium]